MGSRRFKFRLESVLKLRKSREEAALRALGDAQRSHQEALGRKRELESSLAQGFSRRESFGARPSPIVLFGVEQDFISGTKQRILQQEQAIVRAVRGVEKALRTFILTRRHTRAMELLKEKDQLEYRREAARRDRRETEDLAIMRARFSERMDDELDGEGAA